MCLICIVVWPYDYKPHCWENLVLGFSKAETHVNQEPLVGGLSSEHKNKLEVDDIWAIHYKVRVGNSLTNLSSKTEFFSCSAVWTRLELAAINQENHMEVHYLKINKNMEKESICNSREDVTTTVAKKTNIIYIYNTHTLCLSINLKSKPCLKKLGGKT